MALTASVSLAILLHGYWTTGAGSHSHCHKLNPFVAERLRASSLYSVHFFFFLLRRRNYYILFLSKTLNHSASIVQMGRKAIGPVCCLKTKMHTKDPNTLITKISGSSGVSDSAFIFNHEGCPQKEEKTRW